MKKLTILSFCVLAFSLQPLALAADAPTLNPQPSTLNPSALQMFIPLIATALVALVKTVFPKIPRLWLPILCPLLGAAIDILGHFTGLGGGTGLVGLVMGAGGVALREAYDQGKKALAPLGTFGWSFCLQPLALGLLLAAAGCASYGTKQSDRSTYENGQPVRTITTTVKVRTFFSAKSELAKSAVLQTDKSQSSKVGGLSQEGGQTNQLESIIATAIATAIKASKTP